MTPRDVGFFVRGDHLPIQRTSRGKLDAPPKGVISESTMR